jgi:hypothetical protein
MLAYPDMRGTYLLGVLGGKPGVAELFKHLLSTHLTPAHQVSLTEEQWQQQGQVAVADLVQILSDNNSRSVTADILAAALDAAVVAQQHDLTIQLLQEHILSDPDMKGSSLLGVLGKEAGFIALCKHLLGSTNQQQRQNEMVELLKLILSVGEVSLSSSTWYTLVDVFAFSIPIQQQEAAKGGNPPLDSLLELCRLALDYAEGPVAAWHLRAAEQLVAMPGCAVLAGDCLQVSKFPTGQNCRAVLLTTG